MRFVKTLFPLLILLFAVQSAPAANLVFEKTIAGDKRKVRTPSSPKWLAAVGQFRYNDRGNTSAEACTISLVSANNTDDSRIAKTAGHCVRDWSNGGNDQTRRFTPTTHNVYFTTNDGRVIKRKIAAVLKYQSSPGDYAIVLLNQLILNSDIQPLVHAHEKAKGGDYGLLNDPLYKLVFEPFATAAGYSTDITLGAKGRYLTYHEYCYLNGGPEARKDSGCTSYGGASGGPIVVTVDRGVDEWEERPLMGTEYLDVGIIQGGRDGHNERTYWTPNTYYHKALLEVFKSYGIKRNY